MRFQIRLICNCPSELINHPVMSSLSVFGIFLTISLVIGTFPEGFVNFYFGFNSWWQQFLSQSFFNPLNKKQEHKPVLISILEPCIWHKFLCVVNEWGALWCKEIYSCCSFTLWCTVYESVHLVHQCFAFCQNIMDHWTCTLLNKQ